MVVAIVGGTGNLGFGLALRLAAAGEAVCIGSRDAARAQAAALQVNAAAGSALATGRSNAEAAGEGDLVVVTVPVAAQVATLEQIAAAAAGKVVIDTTVSLAPGDPTRLSLPPEGSAAERAQAILAGARVVSALHTISGKLLAAVDKPIEADVLVAGDDAEAKARALALIERIGARAVDAGPLVNSRTLEGLTALIIGMNMRLKRRHIGVRFTGL